MSLFLCGKPERLIINFSYHISPLSTSFDFVLFLRFSITPLLLEVQKTLQISTQEIWTSSITAVAGTIIMRFLLGPFCDKVRAQQ